MSCAYVVLLTSVARMVVTGWEDPYSYYGLYENLIVNEFPVPPPQLGIHMSPSKVTTHGTHIVAYCSVVKDLRQVVDTIIQGRQELTQKPEDRDKAYLTAEDTCARSIAKGTSPDSPAKPMSQILGNDCKPEHLISLAFKGLIGVEGQYACFAPRMRDQAIKIDADTPIQLEKFLSGGHLLTGNSARSSDEAVAWFQGNLHLFKKIGFNTDGYQWWIPITSIGDENANGHILSEFIQSNIPKIREFTKAMKDFQMLSVTLGKMKTTQILSLPSRENAEEISPRYHQIFRERNIDNHYPKYIFFLKITSIPAYIEKKIFRRNTNRAATNNHRQEFFLTKGVATNRNMFNMENFHSIKWARSFLSGGLIEIPPQSNPEEAAMSLVEIGGRGFLGQKSVEPLGKKRRME
ncbi:BgtE-6030 [Blumeria graminis f. sp. tritici]|uniref:BgtE-6030 n=2 Tax=Blumeria graminis f. sp. tritici TaxID=62690 RepID=A0A061HHN1_BLUGR|nr:putative secreted effector protein [Blumeria graminis f. sp. tritici 96224]VDB85978.1 BgtE-6030 [Blumeria graminis f. sp. tritici]